MHGAPRAGPLVVLWTAKLGCSTWTIAHNAMQAIGTSLAAPRSVRTTHLEAQCQLLPTSSAMSGRHSPLESQAAWLICELGQQVMAIVMLSSFIVTPIPWVQGLAKGRPYTKPQLCSMRIVHTRTYMCIAASRPRLKPRLRHQVACAASTTSC